MVTARAREMDLELALETAPVLGFVLAVPLGWGSAMVKGLARDSATDSVTAQKHCSVSCKPQLWAGNLRLRKIQIP